MVDPRSAVTWASLGIKDSLAKLLAADCPTRIQRKMLATNSSMLVKSVPGMGKTTGALLSLAVQENSGPSLVIVPGPRLVDHYINQLNKLGLGNVCAGLYRSGNIENDEKQHKSLDDARIVVGTPSRLLDYLHWKPSSLGVNNLESLVVDELDEYPSQRDAHKQPLEILLEYIMARSRPKATVLSNRADKHSLGSFSTLTEINEAVPEWKGSIRFFNSAGRAVAEDEVESIGSASRKVVPVAEKQLAKLLHKVWAGPGVVVLPNSVSVLNFEQAVRPELRKEIQVFKEGDLAGIPVNTNNFYVVGFDGRTNLEKLKWMLGSGPDKKMFVVLAPC